MSKLFLVHKLHIRHMVKVMMSSAILGPRFNFIPHVEVEVSGGNGMYTPRSANQLCETSIRSKGY